MIIDPLNLIVPQRTIQGITAVLLPYTNAGQVDWDSFASLLQRTVAAGLTPAVNMDTGYVNLLDETTRLKVLQTTREVIGRASFVAGAFVGDEANGSFSLAKYQAQIEPIEAQGGTPVIFQSYGLVNQTESAIVDSYAQIAECCERFIAFELGSMFASFGSIYSLDVYRQLMAIPQCLGAKHSSLNRELEWQRLALRNETRPDFRVYTGNDLAIDMVIYGSDYLLGLSCFAPDAFARRDALWAAGDASWNQLNDLLQYLGFLAFRSPVPAYKHAAAMFLHERGWLPSHATHPQSPTRSSADHELLKQIAQQMDELMS